MHPHLVELPSASVRRCRRHNAFRASSRTCCRRVNEAEDHSHADVASCPETHTTRSSTALTACRSAGVWRCCSAMAPATACACSGRDTGQPDRVLADTIAGDDAERWPGAGKVRLAAAQHEGAEVETVLVDQAKVGEARRQRGPRDV